ncbi:MAG: exodeoxyribonuclease VII small subunit [Clostridiales bacterium]|nr:exodeoxyribonuclease VII small subunit [Clostridiales bacterium]
MKSDKMTYEEALAKLTDTVNKLNSGKVTLDESIKLYQEGISLAAFCDKKLKEVEQKIMLVNKENGFTEEIFDGGDEN